MLGHLRPPLAQLSAEVQQVYWSNYCSLCAGLRNRNGLLYGLLLNHEMTLLLLAFSPYLPPSAESNTKSGTSTACPARFFLSKRPIYRHDAVDWISDLSVVLGWIKAEDWQTDSPRFYKPFLLRPLRKRASRILAQLPSSLQSLLLEYADMTRRNETNFDIVRQQSASLSAGLAQTFGQHFGIEASIIESRTAIFASLGALVAVADHLLDFEKDLYHQQYNPIIQAAQTGNTSYATTYNTFLSDFYHQTNHLLTQCQLLPASDSFAELLRQSLRRLLQQINGNKPLLLQHDIIDFSHRPIIARADLDCGGCDCDCNSGGEEEGACGGCCGSCLGNCCGECSNVCLGWLGCTVCHSKHRNQNRKAKPDDPSGAPRERKPSV